jgi:hypothetical protein
MADTFFIINGPSAGQELPYSNAPFIQEQLPSGRVREYAPAPPELCLRLGPCLVLCGSKIRFLPSGNAVIAHPRWVRTVMNPRTGEIREMEDDRIGAGMNR